MKLFFGITGTGGMIKGSADVSEVHKIEWSGGVIIGKYSYQDRYELSELKQQGYTGQKYALELKNFEREDLTIAKYLFVNKLPKALRGEYYE